MNNRNLAWKQKISQARPSAGRRKALVGFDGYIDELVRVVECRKSEEEYTFFKDISGFAHRLDAAAGKSADIEIVTDALKLGGNAPIMANALACLGMDTVCIGAMGYPKLHTLFSNMPENCDCISICEPARTCAFEFEDGKLMFGNLKPLEQLTWNRIRERIGLKRLIALFQEAELLALVNWSGVTGARDIWEGVLQEILPELSGTRRQVFFDLADPSRKSDGDILEALRLIRAFTRYGDVTVGLNENEALCLYRAIGGAAGQPLEEVGQALFRRLAVKAVVIHPIDRCIAVTQEGILQEQGHVVKSPKISTGGGDNFNAGFCTGQLLGLAVRDSMLLGMEVSGYYVENGYSPAWPELEGKQGAMPV